MKHALMVAVFLYAAALPAFADGGFFGPWSVADTPDLPSQRAVIDFCDNVQTLTVQSRFEGQLTDFAWIIPVPQAVTPDNVTLGDSNRFHELSQRTYPRITVYEEESGYGCIQASDDVGRGLDSSGVTTWAEMSVGPYDIAVISADNGAVLTDWLGANGYNFPSGGDNAVQFYIDKNWYFLAAKVSPYATGSYVSYGLPPLEIRFETGKPVYPMVLTTLSAADWALVTLYVVSDRRYEPENFPWQEFEVRDAAHLEEWWDYTELLYRLDNNSFVLEYAGDVDGRFVSRYTVNIHKNCMTDDFFFTESSSDSTFKYKKTIYLGASSGSGGSGSGPGPLDGLSVLAVLFMAAVFVYRLYLKRSWMVGREPAVALPGERPCV